MFKNVIWATDGSEAADHALPYAKELLAPAGTLYVVHAEEHFYGCLLYTSPSPRD